MNGKEKTRFFDTSGCLNLSRPTNNTNPSTLVTKRARTASIPIRGQRKIDLYNFDHIDFVDSKYVLTSPRSLEACARLNVKPSSLLPIKLADIASDKHRFSTLVDIRDEMELERLANLQRCRDEREKIIQEENQSSSKPGAPQRKTSTQGLHRATRVQVTPSSQTDAESKQKKTHLKRAPLKPTVAQWGSLENTMDDARSCSSASLLEDVRRMDQQLQRIGTSKQTDHKEYLNELENVKLTLEQRVQKSNPVEPVDHSSVDKKQYELLLGHYEHELKLEKARENVRRSEIEKNAERHQTLMHEFLGLTMAEERRQNEMRRRLEKIHQSRQLYEALQAKNHELKLADERRRHSELLQDIQRKDRRSQHFLKDKQETVHLSRTIAKSSQDTREYLRENRENFDEKVRKAELTSSILVTKPRLPIDRRYLQESVRS